MNFRVDSRSQRTLRQRILKLRRALPPEERANLSAIICENFIETLKSKSEKPGVVALYRAQEDELNLKTATLSLQKAGWSTAFPKIIPVGGNTLQFHACSEDGPWEKGPLAIEEPSSDTPAVDPASIKMLIVPGVAFDPQGNRVGMGKGYYDRFLSLIPNARRVALAYDFQIVESVQRQTWDIPMDWIITEKRILILK